MKKKLAICLLAASFSLCSCQQNEPILSIKSIELTSVEGNVDIYTITYSDGSKTNFKVTNGVDGKPGIQGEPGQNGETPTISIGANGNWFVNGVDSGIKAQGETGQDGKTPVVGPNGNWWVKEQIQALVQQVTKTN